MAETKAVRQDLARQSAERLHEWILAAGPLGRSAVLAQLLDEEDELVLANRIKPYEEKVPALLASFDAPSAAELISGLDPRQARRALFGNFTRISDERLCEILTAMDAASAAVVVSAMAVGYDAPAEMARLLARLGSASGAILSQTHPAAVLRLLQEAALYHDAIAEGLRPPAARAVVSTLLATGSSFDAACAAAVVAVLRPGVAAEVAPQLDSAARAVLAGVRWPGIGARRPLMSRSELISLDNDSLADALVRQPPVAAPGLLRELGAGKAAMVIRRIAETDEWLAADVCAAMDRRILLRRPVFGREPAWSVLAGPSRAVAEILRRGDATALRLAERRQASREIFALHLGAPAGRGRRTVRYLDAGMRWIHIDEQLDDGRTVKPVVIDVLEIDPARVRLTAGIATSEETALPVARVAQRFEHFRQTGARPGNAEFADLGLVRLSEAVRSAGAVAGINGNFYFDYGHYLTAKTLGIEIEKVPGLYFGDPIGWFVSGGRELIPAAFNRAAGVVANDGQLRITRISMDRVTLANGQQLSSRCTNVSKQSEQVMVYTSLWGVRTESSRGHVDVAIARGRVRAIDPTGDQVIPLTGFVLSVPASQAQRLLAGVTVGSPVTTHNCGCDEALTGDVAQAMACGPLLVRDGAIDVDFAAEDFGQQDGTVMSFFLPRSVETYEAARSFMALRQGTLLLGTVSGTAYGFGPAQLSRGLTFGELAQLCVDLGADDAYALDGGGSSSLVASESGQIRVLNAPTGGFDVAAGDERFINTYWLVHEISDDGDRPFTKEGRDDR